jgi:hypothetical protein
MRRCLLIIAFIALSGGLWLLWQARYERVPGFPVLTLENLRNNAQPIPGMEWCGVGENTKVRLTVRAGGAPLAASFKLPFPAPVGQLHVKCHMKAQELVRGKELWEDGRVMIEWRSPDGGRRISIDPVVSGCGSEVVDLRGMVIGHKEESGLPVLRLEHLGAGGSYEVSDLEIIYVRECALWKAGSWIFAALWGGWMFLLIRSWPGVAKWRALAASLVGLVIATQVVVPGPWKVTRPMAGDFWLGDGAAPATPVFTDASGSAALVSGQVAPEGRLPHQGSLILRVKLALDVLRPLLHMFLLLGPALLMFCLVGRRPGLLLMVMLALGVELAQYLFGYGFDATDLWDLTNDSIGIGAAVAGHALLGRRFGSRVMCHLRQVRS